MEGSGGHGHASTFQPVLLPEMTDFGRADTLFNTPEEKHSVSLEHSLCQADRAHPSSFRGEITVRKAHVALFLPLLVSFLL